MDIMISGTHRRIGKSFIKKIARKKSCFLWKAKCYCWSSSQNGYFCIEVGDNFLSINSSKPRLVCGRFMYHLECSLYSIHNSPYCNPETWVCGHVDFACFDVSVVYLSHFWFRVKSQVDWMFSSVIYLSYNVLAKTGLKFCYLSKCYFEITAKKQLLFKSCANIYMYICLFQCNTVMSFFSVRFNIL